MAALTHTPPKAPPDRLDRLLQGLHVGNCFPHPTDELELVETHISKVYLAGKFAYKFKKPVDLGFVDFSTLEKRRRFCEEELRLNRRLAPQLYLDVIAVTGSLDAPQLDGQGDVIEYAVKMRRFPQKMRLDQVCTRNELSYELIDHLADTIADFHARIPIAGPGSAHGSPQQVAAPMRENFSQIRACMDSSPDWGLGRSLLQELEPWLEDELARRESELECRLLNGAIRECHGDLHLGNMVLDNEEMLLFDCIEFNANLRWIDTFSEIAFLLMDLDFRGRRCLSRRLLNRYLERTGDYQGLSLLPLYLSYRAMVRAKVAALRARQRQREGLDNADARGEFEQYLALARHYTRPNFCTPLIITHGLSGSGKSWLSEQLTELLGAVRVRSDVERKRLLGLDAGADTGEREEIEPYSEEQTHLTYQRLIALGCTILQAGYPAVVDASCIRTSQRAPFLRLARAMNTALVILDMRAPTELLEQRIHTRRRAGEDPSEADIEVLHMQQKALQPLSTQENLFAIQIDNRGTVDAGSIAHQIVQRCEQFAHGAPNNQK